jgi:hypothetical protein
MQVWRITSDHLGNGVRAPRREERNESILKKLVSAVMLVLALISGLALVSCGGGNGGTPLDDRGDCTRRAFPQCSPR